MFKHFFFSLSLSHCSFVCTHCADTGVRNVALSLGATSDLQFEKKNKGVMFQTQPIHASLRFCATVSSRTPRGDVWQERV